MGGELNLLFAALPPRIASAAQRLSQGRGDLLEIVLDLGRQPEARFTEAGDPRRGRSPTPTSTTSPSASVVFGEDNRAGIERTLHRISRHPQPRGHDRRPDLPRRPRRLRHHRHHPGHRRVSGKSILMLGRPGVGKTTMLREVRARARRRAAASASSSSTPPTRSPATATSRTPAIGRARRMQVPHARAAARGDDRGRREPHAARSSSSTRSAPSWRRWRRAPSPSAACSSSAPPTATPSKT